MTKRTYLNTIAAGVAVVGLSTAAPALGADSLPLPSDASVQVAQGKIEHTVKIDRVSGPKAIQSHTRTEQWLSRDRSHTIVTDLRTGRLKAETVATRTEIRAYNADEGVTRVERRRKPGGLPVNGFSFEAAIQKAYVQHGYVRVIGEKQVNGRRALITENAEGKWRTDNPSSRTVAVVDAETFALYERTTTVPGSHTHEQQFPVNEVLDATPQNVTASMAMRSGSRAASAALVPAGKIEHSIVTRKVSGSRAVASRERTERWLTRTHSRTVVTNLETGKVRMVVTTSPYETRIDDRETGKVTVRNHKRSEPPYKPAGFEAEVQRGYLADGITRQIGEKLVDGRRAFVLESVPGKWRSSEPQSRTVVTVDAETFALLERTTGLPSDEFSQTEVYEKLELLPATGKAAKALKR
jgi:hypothetical protein